MKNTKPYISVLGKFIKSGLKICGCALIATIIYNGYPYIQNYFGKEDKNSDVGTVTCDQTEYVTLPSGTDSEVKNYTGFVVSFNKKHHLPNYVVWSLTRDNVYTNVVGKRQELFAEDRSVKGCPTLEDYKRSGYDRGHMAPAADMKWNQQAQNDCFLMTNMAPQKNELNDGAWRKLEEKCRDWAIRDSALIIVCGPILSDAIKNHIGWSRVSVPERFFKVVLAPYTKPPRAIGFIMPNGEVPGGMQAAACPIDDIEAITGLDFFPFIPDEIEAILEKQCDFNAWSKRSKGK